MNSLYVYKEVKNSSVLTQWAKSQGFTSVVDDAHITLAYSRAKVIGYKPSEDITVLHPEDIIGIESLGNEGAVVIKYKSQYLAQRWSEIRDMGATWDYPDYHPHVTITYKKPENMDLSKLKKPEFVIILGPEKFEELDDDKNYTDK